MKQSTNDQDWLDEIGQDTPEMDWEVDSLKVEGEEEIWLKERAGRITGSVLGKLVKKDRKGGYMMSTGKMADDLLYKIAWERFLMHDAAALMRNKISTKATDHGQTWEQEAIDKFTEITGLEVKSTGQSFIAMGDYFGGTPDGEVSDNGLIEVKCPYNGGNHLRSLIEKVVYNDDHWFQMQGYMMMMVKGHCWYVTYDPDLPEGLNLSILKVDRDEEVIQAIREIIDQAMDKVDQMVQELSKHIKTEKS